MIIYNIAKYEHCMSILRRGEKFAKKYKRDFKYGLDFGTGKGVGLIAARDFDLEIVGLDTPFAKSVTLDGLSKMEHNGYKIIIRDTMKYPWVEFKDDEFDFIMARWSMHKFKHDPKQLVNKKWFDKRMIELARITKKGGIWLIYPRQDQLRVQARKHVFSKKIYIRGARKRQ